MNHVLVDRHIASRKNIGICFAARLGFCYSFRGGQTDNRLHRGEVPRLVRINLAIPLDEIGFILSIQNLLFGFAVVKKLVVGTRRKGKAHHGHTPQHE